MGIQRNIRYLNENIVSAHIVMKRIQMVVGGLLSLFFLFGIVEVLIGEIERRHISVYLIFFIPSLLMFWRAVRTGMLIESARRYEMIIYGARDGIVTAEELELKMGKPGYKIFRELEKIFRKGYLQNCALQRGGDPCIIIYDMVYEGNTGPRLKDEM